MKGRGLWLLLPAVMSLSCLPLTSTSTSPMPSPASPSMLAFALHTPMRFCRGVSTARRVGGSRGGLREATPRPGSRRNGRISLPELRLARSSSASSARLGSENPKATAAPASPSEKDEGKGKGKGKAKAKGKDQAESGKVVGACGVWRWSLSPPDKTGGANDVATFRHVEHGIGIELWQGSFGWFDFVPRPGEDVMLCDSWAVQIKRNVKHFSMPAQWEALGEEISRGGGGTLEPGSPSFKIGSWSVEVLADGNILIFNKHSRRQRLLLRPDGFAFIGSLSKGLLVEKGNDALDVDVRDLIGLLPPPPSARGRPKQGP